MARHFIHYGFLNNFLMLPQGSARRRRQAHFGRFSGTVSGVRVPSREALLNPRPGKA
jgi:hypothetical protein